MQWLQSISVFSSTKLLAAADCEMVYFILFLILTIVLPAFFVTAAPVRVYRSRGTLTTVQPAIQIARPSER